jgi:hypothetical protein
MTESERIEAISVEKALEHATMRAIVRDFSPDKHNMMILAEEVKRLRRVLANEVNHHVAKIDALKLAESRALAAEKALAEAQAALSGRTVSCVCGAEKALADWKAKCGPWFPWDSEARKRLADAEEELAKVRPGAIGLVAAVDTALISSGKAAQLAGISYADMFELNRYVTAHRQHSDKNAGEKPWPECGHGDGADCAPPPNGGGKPCQECGGLKTKPWGFRDPYTGLDKTRSVPCPKCAPESGRGA